MPNIWEVLYDGDSSDFYGTRSEAEYVIRLGNNEASLIRHEYTPTQKGIADLINRVALQATGKPKENN